MHSSVFSRHTGLCYLAPDAIDCLQRPPERFPAGGEDDKLIWCLAIFLVHGIGAVLYYFLVYKKDLRGRMYPYMVEDCD